MMLFLYINISQPVEADEAVATHDSDTVSDKVSYLAEYTRACVYNICNIIGSCQ